MLKILESLDIKLIEKLRTQALGRGLDEHDNFSWHAVLTEDGEPVGAARLYKHEDGMMADLPAVPSHDAMHEDMLFRTLLLKCEMMHVKHVYVACVDGYYRPFGFAEHKTGMRADVTKIVYPKKCGG